MVVYINIKIIIISFGGTISLKKMKNNEVALTGDIE